MITCITGWGNQFLEDRLIASRIKLSALDKEFYIMDEDKIEPNILENSNLIIIGRRYSDRDIDEVLDIINEVNKYDTPVVFAPENDISLLLSDSKNINQIAKMVDKIIDTSVYRDFTPLRFEKAVSMCEYHPVDYIIEKFGDEVTNSTIIVNHYNNSQESFTALVIAQHIAKELGLTALVFGMSNADQLTDFSEILPIASVSSDWIYQLIARSQLFIDFDKDYDDRFRIAAKILGTPCLCTRTSIKTTVNDGTKLINSDNKTTDMSQYDISKGIDKLNNLLGCNL